MIPGKVTRMVLFVTLAAALCVMASGFLLAAFSFGFERGDMVLEYPGSKQRADDLNRAANIALGLFLAAELGATLLVLKSAVFSPIPLHWIVKFVVLIVGFGGYSFGLILLSLSGGAPRVLTDLLEALGNLIMR